MAVVLNTMAAQGVKSVFICIKQCVLFLSTTPKNSGAFCQMQNNAELRADVKTFYSVLQTRSKSQADPCGARTLTEPGSTEERV